MVSFPGGILGMWRTGSRNVKHEAFFILDKAFCLRRVRFCDMRKFLSLLWIYSFLFLYVGVQINHWTVRNPCSPRFIDIFHGLTCLGRWPTPMQRANEYRGDGDVSKVARNIRHVFFFSFSIDLLRLSHGKESITIVVFREFAGAFGSASLNLNFRTSMDLEISMKPGSATKSIYS